MAAVRGKNSEVVKYLCQQCVKPNGVIDVNYECKRNGLTAFSRAVLQQTFVIAETLIKHGNADKNYINKLEGKSILVLAVEMKLQKAIEYLLSGEDEVDDSNLKDKLGMSKEVIKQKFHLTKNKDVPNLSVSYLHQENETNYTSE